MRICNYKSIKNMRSSNSRIQSRVKSSFEYNNEKRYEKKCSIWKSMTRIISIFSSLIFSRSIAHELQTSVITEKIRKRLLFSRCYSLRLLENFARVWISILRTSNRFVISTALMSRLFRIRIKIRINLRLRHLLGPWHVTWLGITWFEDIEDNVAMTDKSREKRIIRISEMTDFND
jgi:hypothetical protein